ncbi:serine/threonine protein phosphatase 1 [Sagittula marina]|uniref:Serine/threonine protein phosphatase 1 n=1 Tax=Sagittula marina TaxID=943940 RepID=A0A7W6GSF7_9RHOB|nr:metallophosphoesterase family protein [Sagittula marina]MBB3984079.1 serine/threonine protein phosphatase 1 [Sagittula marina]
MTQKLYAMGDIHGQREMLEGALSLIEADGGRDARIVFLGDYVDRGPESKGVIEILAQGVAEGRNWTCIKGNHDRLFEWFVTPPHPRNDPHLIIGYDWTHPNIGGRETMQSYGVEVPERIRSRELADEVRAKVPDHHLTFLNGLKLSHREAGKFFVHAGVRPGVPLADQVEDDMVWIRDEFLKDTRDHGALVVHGHTPVDAPELHANRLNLDTGAGKGHPLSVAVFEGEEISILRESGRVRLG